MSNMHTWLTMKSQFLSGLMRTKWSCSSCLTLCVQTQGTAEHQHYGPSRDVETPNCTGYQRSVVERCHQMPTSLRSHSRDSQNKSAASICLLAS